VQITRDAAAVSLRYLRRTGLIRPLRFVENFIASWPIMFAFLAIGIGAQCAGITVRWTAPGDDNSLGRATAYDMRSSLTPITELNFLSATPVPGMPVPGNPGTLQSASITSLLANTSYYFAIRTRDDAGNWSKISNLLFVPASTAVGDGAPALWFSTPWPNPSREPVKFFYTLPQTGQVTVDVYDVAGRLVRSLARGTFPAGRGDIEWDLKDTGGAQMAAGVYMVRAKVAEANWTRRVVITR
jgi:hypothetical protein